MQTNEIRDYLERAPKRYHYNGQGIVNNTYARLAWLATIARGTLDKKINRRAGIKNEYIPWKNPVYSAIKRHKRRNVKREFRFLFQ